MVISETFPVESSCTTEVERWKRESPDSITFPTFPKRSRRNINLDLNLAPPHESCLAYVDDNGGEQLDTNPHGRRTVIDLNRDLDDLGSEPGNSNTNPISRELGVSLLDTFTAEQIQAHIGSLGDRLSNESAPGDENICQLCGKEALFFAVLTKDCESCGRIIKPGSDFYTADEAKHCFCASCFKNTRKKGCIWTTGGLSFPKSKLCKGVRDVPQEEGWVQCENCQRWQHQVCALYNDVLDSERGMSYICAHCRLLELQRVKEDVRPSRGAGDLLSTDLSNYIEDRLSRSLRQERKQRAASLGLCPEGVPGAEDIVVRVVLNVDKEIEVKQQYLDILQGEGYPSKFPYKSKVILLFQRIKGVEVCIFAMYVQEFGSECGQPTQRSVYISYLDSVRYFTPDVKTISGEALRTFVYHEVLIGYLEFCKNHGFNTCYIWVCPPSTGDDYILYCHPETQKIPKSKKLLKWYKTMLKRAYKEKVVAEYTNFYDYFLVPKGNSKITAARLPYFEGVYWTGVIEEMIEQSQKVNSSTTILKRTFLSMGHNGLSPEAAEDVQVMQELEHRMLPVKENFIVVHLQSQVTQVDVAANTEDGDELIDNEIFQTRLAFLNFCKEKHYQFDTLRRAKHSSMMILYNLHKDPVFKFLRNACRPNLEMKARLDVLSHANECLTSAHPCAGPKCVRIRGLILHTLDCKVQVTGGCKKCIKLLSMIFLHARYCADSSCTHIYCSDTKQLGGRT